MWVRRAPQEIASIEARQRRALYNPVVPIVIAVIVTAFVAVAGRHGFHSVFSSRALLPTLFITFLLIYFGMLFAGTNPGNVLFCPACNRPETATPDGTCHCGGKLEPLSYWRWVEDGNEN